MRPICNAGIDSPLWRAAFRFVAIDLFVAVWDISCKQSETEIRAMRIVHVAVTMVMAAGLMSCATAEKNSGAMAKSASLAANEIPAPAKEKLSGLDAIVEAGIAKKDYPGAVLIVGQPGKQIYAKAYGNHTYDPASPPMTMDTLFDMASISKVEGTSAASWKLMDEGKIHPDDLVSKFIPGFDSNGKEGDTVRDLMTHVSGLKAYENKDLVEKERTKDESHADALIAHYAALTASYKPRTKFIYSCLNFQTMARVNETASGMRQQDYLRKNVYGPLGMNDTTYVLTAEQKSRTAPTHVAKDGDLLIGVIHDPLANYHSVDEDHCPGNAGLFSTAPDLAKFCETIAGEGEFRGKRIYSKEVMRASSDVQTPEAVHEKRGLGLDIYENPPYTTTLNDTAGNRILGHTGFTGTLFVVDQHTKTYVVFLTNTVFPTEAGKSDKEPSATQERKDIVDVVWRAMPEYQEYFAALDAAPKEKAAAKAAGAGQ
ncbi:hypothetical protein BH09SUM1_BH09SUM1_07560 [soil metagenome]